MNVFVPQWQGAGERDLLAAGAAQVRDALAIAWTEIPGLTSAGAAREHGVVNHRALLANLRAFRALLADTRPEQLFLLGGDCSIELAPIGYFATRHRDLVVIWVDAHADANTPETSPSGTLHGMPVRLLLGEGDPQLLEALGARLADDQLALAGVRALDPQEVTFVAARSITQWSVDAIETDPHTLVAPLAGRTVYVHVDIDVLDPRTLGGIACPAPDGLSRGGLERLIEQLTRRCTVVGGSVVEFAGGPPHEVAWAAQLFRALSRC